MSTPTTPAPAADSKATTPAAPAADANAAAPPTPPPGSASEQQKLPPPLVTSEGAPPPAGEKKDAAPPPSENDFTEWPKDFDEGVKGALSDLGKELATELKLDGAAKTTAMKALVKRWEAAAAESAKRAEEAFVQQAHAHTKQAAEHPAVKQLGGLDKARTLASTALNKLGSKGLNDVLASTGLAYHPEVLAFFAAVGKSLGEDSVAGGASSARPAPTQREQLAATYTHPTSKSMFTE